jgi:2-desacetyl-2-hydroxyethyl bacteriochlorophyllide A dehydrogenase
LWHIVFDKRFHLNEIILKNFLIDIEITTCFFCHLIWQIDACVSISINTASNIGPLQNYHRQMVHLTNLGGMLDILDMTKNFRHMQALWLEDQKLELRRQIPIPTLRPDHALIQVHKAGICTTDLELCRGYYPFSGILGHEFVGTIVAAPDEPEHIGERVVGDINISCGKCVICCEGHPKHCRNRKVLGIWEHHGALAQYMVLPLKNTVCLSPAIDDDWAVFAEPLAAALQIQSQVTFAPHDRVLIIGAGMLGQLIARVLAPTCQLTVMARHPFQQQLLASAGIRWVPEEPLKARSYDVVIEATGNPKGFSIAQKAVRPAGTIVLKSTYRGSVRVDLSSLVVDEIQLIGSRCGSMAHAVEVLLEKGLDPTPLIEARYPLKEALTAFAHAKAPGALKILIEMPV